MDGVNDAIRRSRNLEKIVIINPLAMDDSFFSFDIGYLIKSGFSQKLNQLELKNCHQHDYIKVINEYGRNLRKLILEDSITNIKFIAGNNQTFGFRLKFQNLKNLRYLKLMDCDGFNTTDLISVATKCVHLETLILTNRLYICKYLASSLSKRQKSSSWG